MLDFTFYTDIYKRDVMLTFSIWNSISMDHSDILDQYFKSKSAMPSNLINSCDILRDGGLIHQR